MVEECNDLFTAIGQALGDGKLRILTVGDSSDADGDQRDDDNNNLAPAPGVVVGFERNTWTNTVLRDHGV